MEYWSIESENRTRNSLIMKQVAEIQALYLLSIVFWNSCFHPMRYYLSNIGEADTFHFVPVSINSFGLSRWFSFELSWRQTSNA
jgi:hypothetical protein